MQIQTKLQTNLDRQPHKNLDTIHKFIQKYATRPTNTRKAKISAIRTTKHKSRTYGNSRNNTTPRKKRHTKEHSRAKTHRMHRRHKGGEAK